MMGRVRAAWAALRGRASNVVMMPGGGIVTIPQHLCADPTEFARQLQWELAMFVAKDERALPDGSVLYRPVPIEEVIVLKGRNDDVKVLEQLAQDTGSLVVDLGAGSSLEMLDEDAMRQAGWIKA